MDSSNLPKENSNGQTVTRTIFLIIVLLTTLERITAVIFLPSLVAIANELATSATAVKLSIPSFLIGFSIAQLIYGPISDRIGRRLPILFGIGFSIIGTLLCFLAPTVQFIIFGRFIEGIGVSACVTVSRCIARDLMAGDYLAKLFSEIGMIDMLILALAFITGGFIQVHFGWRMNFLVLMIYTFSIGLLVWKALPETNRFLNLEALHIKAMLHNYLSILKNKTFLGFVFSTGAAFAGLAAYQLTTPFLLQNVIGLNPLQYGFLGVLVAGAIIVGAFINSRLILRKGILGMLIIGIFMMIIGGLVMLIFALMGYINTLVVMGPVAIFDVGVAITILNGLAGAMNLFPEMAGSVSSLLGFLQLSIASIASSLLALLPTNNQIPLAMMYIILGIAAFICYKFLCKQK